MPQGIKRIQQLSEQAAARSAAYESGSGGDGVRALKLGVGETAIGRFLEEGEHIWYLYMHELPRKPNQQYGDKILCLDQNDAGERCYGCELDGVKRTARVAINFLRYDEPKLRREPGEGGKPGKAVKDAQGNYVFDGVEPAVVLWEASQTVGGRIAYLEMENSGGNDAHGISNHVVKIRRSGPKEWDVDVVEKNKPPEPWEVELFKGKVSPDKAITNVFPRFMSRPLMSYGDMVRAYGGSVPSSFQGGDASNGQPQESNIYTQASQGRINTSAFGA